MSLSIEDVLNDTSEEVQTFEKVEASEKKKRIVSENVGAKPKAEEDKKKHRALFMYSDKQKPLLEQAMKLEGINPNSRNAFSELINKCVRRDLIRQGIDLEG